jgi:ComF family protein
MKQLFRHFRHLFYPQLCSGCGSDLVISPQVLCHRCHHQLPFTTFESVPDNPVERVFWGRAPLQSAASLLYFTPDSLVQHLLHRLKYHSDTALGLQLGRLMGYALQASGRFATADLLVPLPLFAAREQQRGYNQSAVLCKGIAEVLQLPVCTGAVVRQRATQSQTRKGRTERWQNVATVFALQNPAALQQKNIILVDDVVTTGATLEACANTLLQAPGLSLSVSTLAYASR